MRFCDLVSISRRLRLDNPDVYKGVEFPTLVLRWSDAEALIDEDRACQARLIAEGNPKATRYHGDDPDELTGKRMAGLRLHVLPKDCP